MRKSFIKTPQEGLFPIDIFINAGTTNLIKVVPAFPEVMNSEGKSR
jgi:hypothetical protein